MGEGKTQHLEAKREALPENSRARKGDWGPGKGRKRGEVRDAESCADQVEKSDAPVKHRKGKGEKNRLLAHKGGLSHQRVRKDVFSSMKCQEKAWKKRSGPAFFSGVLFAKRKAALLKLAAHGN